MKKLLFMAAAALAVATVSLPAQAGTSAGIAIGEPYPGYDPNPGYHPPYPTPDYDDEDEEDQISCREGKQILRERAFRQVRPVKCYGSIYRYQARKAGRPWIVRLNSYSGRIVSARPLRGY